MKRIIVALAVALALPAAAQQLVVSTGAPQGSTYTQMFTELTDACRDIPLRGVNSGGAIENMDRLVANQVNAAIVQTDIIWLRSKTDDLTNIKTLVALHPEEVHVLVRAAGIKERGLLNKFSAPKQPRDVRDTVGATVASAGGSLVSAKVVDQLARLSWQVVDAGSTAAALKMLASGDADVAVLVGGAPLGSLSALGQEFRLLGFDGLQEQLGRVYVPAKISYPKMASTGVQTVATEALLVTQDYKSKQWAGMIKQLRICLAQNLDELREAVGTHPKWKAVRVDNRGKWTWYEAPGK